VASLGTDTRVERSLVAKEFLMAATPIVSDPNVMIGKPVVAGPRISVELILEELAAGTSADELIAGHPALTPEAISAAIRSQTLQGED
jgi:uncharacterized protein (DUF433 family)